jgi:hypothetical protein
MFKKSLNRPKIFSSMPKNLEERKLQEIESSHQEEVKEAIKSEESFRNFTVREMSNIRKDIQSIVAPKFLDISVQLKDLIELAVEIWRLENRTNKILLTLPENQKEAFSNSIQKLKRYLDKNDIEVIDHTNQKFNEGRNLDILAVEKDPNATESLIKETKEPTVMFKGQVVRKGKVIILAKENIDPVGVQNE